MRTRLPVLVALALVLSGCGGDDKYHFQAVEQTSGDEALCDAAKSDSEVVIVAWYGAHYPEFSYHPDDGIFADLSDHPDDEMLIDEGFLSTDIPDGYVEIVQGENDRPTFGRPTDVCLTAAACKLITESFMDAPNEAC